MPEAEPEPEPEPEPSRARRGVGADGADVGTVVRAACARDEREGDGCEQDDQRDGAHAHGTSEEW